MPVRSIPRITTSIVLVVFLFAGSLGAQTLPEPLPSDPVVADSSAAQPEIPVSEKPISEQPLSPGIMHQLMQDQKSIWTSPFRVKKSDAKWLLPLTAATALAFTKDQQISHKFDAYPSLQKKSLSFSQIGGPLATFGTAGALLAIGKMTGNDHMAGAGFRGVEALTYTQAVMHGLKFITDRKRPGDGGTGKFWSGGDSFPSGHAMESWALATVVAEQYHNKPLVKFGMYGLATAISFSRMSAERHYASDVLVGSAIGYMIGRFVVRHHPQTTD
jgi:membrane-associated phospholipid phosphatase